MVALKITESKGELLISTTRTLSWRDWLVEGPFSGALAGFLFGYFFIRPWDLLLGLAGAAAGAILAARIKTAQLRITERHFTRRGIFKGTILPIRKYLSSSVRWIEFQSEAGGGSDVPYHPSGLYAVLESGSGCLIPYLDELQTTELIERISRTFPSMADCWRHNSPFDTHLTTFRIQDKN